MQLNLKLSNKKVYKVVNSTTFIFGTPLSFLYKNNKLYTQMQKYIMVNGKIWNL